jgi:CheY-like chemotaxis protein
MRSILVIDDDLLVRQTVVQLLESFEYRTLAAADGKSGLALFRSEQPDLVVTDIIMPEQEGLRTIAEIRRERHDAKIIAMSGCGYLQNPDLLALAAMLGATATIAKPFDPEDLESIVESCLAGTRLGAAGGDGCRLHLLRHDPPFPTRRLSRAR